jgi:hypothetical protein
VDRPKIKLGHQWLPRKFRILGLAFAAASVFSITLSGQQRDYGPPIHPGITSDAASPPFPTFYAACSSANSAGAALAVTSASTVDTSATCGSPLVFNGGKIRPAAGRTITFTVQSAPLTTICDVSLGGNCVIISPMGLVYVQWWGANCNNRVDSTAAITAAFTSIHAVAQSMHIGYGTCLTDPITALKGDDHILGAGTGASFLKSRSGGPVFSINAVEIDRTHLHDFSIVGAGRGSGMGISVVTSSPSSSNHWHNLNFIDIGGTCLYFPRGFTNHFENIEMKCGKGGMGNGFDIDAGNTTTIQDSYVYDVGTNGTAYRVHSGYLVCISCNGINHGAKANWGVFGDNAAEDEKADYVQASFINVNAEHFTNIGLRFKAGSSLSMMNGGKIEAGPDGPVIAMQFDYAAAPGIFNGTVVTTDGAKWANGQAIHTRGIPFFNLGGGTAGHGTSVVTAWDDGHANVINIPTQTVCYNGNLKYASCFDQIQLPNVYLFGLGIIGNSTRAPIVQGYGDAAPRTGSHARGEIVWNTTPASGGEVGWVCVAAGTPGDWKAFGAIR